MGLLLMSVFHSLIVGRWRWDLQTSAHHHTFYRINTVSVLWFTAPLKYPHKRSDLFLCVRLGIAKQSNVTLFWFWSNRMKAQIFRCFTHKFHFFSIVNWAVAKICFLGLSFINWFILFLFLKLFKQVKFYCHWTSFCSHFQLVCHAFSRRGHSLLVFVIFLCLQHTKQVSSFTSHQRSVCGYWQKVESSCCWYVGDV